MPNSQSYCRYESIEIICVSKDADLLRLHTGIQTSAQAG